MRRLAKRGRWWLAGSASLAIVLVFVWFMRPAHDQPLNVLLITLDTTRADHLGCYGDAAAKTPALDHLASQGVTFDRAYATAPITLTSHASLFTGLYPPEHGVLTNGRGKLNASIPTLASSLQERNYQTAAFVASFVLDSKFGLDHGFDVYDDDMSITAAGDGHAHDHRERDGASVVDRALKWLRTPRDQPFFCWAHLYDPHSPYDSHTDLFQKEFRDRPYDGEIAYVDRQIERLVNFLKSTGIDRRTVVIIVGDHGEGLGEHGEQTHGYTLYNSTQHVPLIMAGPKGFSSGHRHLTPVSLVDLLPTLCEVLKLPLAADISGRSFAAALSGKPVEPVDCYSATDDPFFQEGWSPLRSLTTQRWKYMRTAKPELYDLETDPHERNNLASAEPSTLAKLESRLAELESSMSSRAASTVLLTERERKTLESLGYFGGGAASSRATVESGLIDVKDMLGFDTQAREALSLMQSGRLDEAIDRLQAIVKSADGHSASRVFLGQALESKGRLNEAIACYEDALRIKPDHLEALSRLALLQERQEHYDRAVESLDELLRIDPNSVDEQIRMGRVLLKMGKPNEAAEHLREALRLDPKIPDARVLLSEALSNLGDTEEAIVLLRQEMELYPISVPARLRLASQEAGAEPQVAFRLLAEAIQIQPDNPHVHFEIGKLLVRLDRRGEAIRAFETTLRLMPQHPQAREELSRARAGRN